ncbi:hypothetical protein C5S42_07695 [Candidatus Methanomarinus sp.]|jgi:hypothetical protein|nr:hypothetical protein C5S42_07695 [ANME-2 cluster archaeon]
MKQVKEFSSDKKANKWLKENQDKEIIDIKFSVWRFAIIYEE